MKTSSFVNHRGGQERFHCLVQGPPHPTPAGRDRGDRAGKLWWPGPCSDKLPTPVLSPGSHPCTQAASQIERVPSLPRPAPSACLLLGGSCPIPDAPWRTAGKPCKPTIQLFETRAKALLLWSGAQSLELKMHFLLALRSFLSFQHLHRPPFIPCVGNRFLSRSKAPLGPLRL